ncbi:MAG: DUF1616 domain-containing protein [Thermoplasmata archaeon]|nr:DUF1616 domain-containing protein [Thermoplasmata archaeon]
MKFEVRERPLDLYAMMVLSTLLVIVIVLIPNAGALRVILGLPFILFFPGYALISALYPEKPISIEADDGLSRPRDDETDDSEEEVREKKGLDGLERVALALGLSIAITPLLGLILNYTYDWDPDHLGIRLVPILVTQYGFIIITSIVAVRRRGLLPLEDRFEIVIDIEMPRDHSTADKVLTVGIVVMMLLSVGMLIYIIVVPREGEAFTEFYVLGSGGMADDYPRNFIVGEPRSIFIGVGNHEHRTMNFTIVLSIDPTAENVTVSSLNDLTLSTVNRPSLGIQVKDGSTLEIPCNFTIDQPGSYKLQLLLFRGERMYRDLHLWVRVFSENDLVSIEDPSLQFFIAGPDIGPFEMPAGLEGSGVLDLTLGLVNQGGSNVELNVTVQIGSPDQWTPLEGDPLTADLTAAEGVFFQIYLTAHSSVALPLRISVEEGTHVLVFSLNGQDWTETIQDDLVVGEG